MRRRFTTLDVFTSRRFAGNPLAVVRDAEGLDDAEMQTIAREFNLPETVFVLTAKGTGHRAKLRIFTTAMELPFAGHPTVGAAVLLGCMSGYNGRAHHMVLEETIGLVHCAVTPEGKEHGHASFVIPRLPEKLDALSDIAAIAAALGLDESDIGFGAYEPALWSAGVPVNFVPVRDLDVIARAKPDGTYFTNVFGRNGPSIAYLFCGETIAPDHQFHARMFAPALGIPEDPATGAAAAAFAGVLAEAGGLGTGEHSYAIEQGYEMGRPSLIELGMTTQDGMLTRATIGGAAVIVTDGHIEA